MKDQAALSLEHFVSATITQIVRGIREADSEIAIMGGCVNPGTLLRQPDGAYGLAEVSGNPIRRAVEIVEFDVLLSVRASEEVSGKTGVNVVVTAAVNGTRSSEDARASRVKFRIPVVYPTSTSPDFPATKILSSD